MSKNTYKTFIEPSLIYGGIIGGVILLHSVVLHIMNITFSTYGQVMGTILPIFLLTYCLYSYRKEYLGGIMPYSRGLGMGVLFSVVYGLITTAYLIILIKFIDPNYMELVRQMTEEKLLKKGLSEDLIEQTMEMGERFRTLGFMSITGFFVSVLMGTIFSLIIMIFLKKEPKDPFANLETK